MRLKQIAAALLACMALGALAANAAQAGQWTIGTEENQTKPGVKLVSEFVNSAKHPGTELTFSSTILGLPVTLTAGNVHCWVATTCSLSTTEKGEVKGEGALEFTEIKVSVPKCSVPKNTIVTERLTQKGFMDPNVVGSTAVFETFIPENETETITVIEFEGVECPLTGVSASLKGTACGEVVHTLTPGTYTSSPTGTLFQVQTLRFGEAQQKTGAYTEVMKNEEKTVFCSLRLGTKPGQLTGAVDSELRGFNSGRPWGAD